jgi:hypothetical protein
VPAQPAPAPGTRKKAVTEKLLHNGRAVAYREQWCLRAPSRPSPDFAKGNGEGRPVSDMLTLSSHTSTPQPEPRENPVHTLNDATGPAMLTVNGG